MTLSRWFEVTFFYPGNDEPQMRAERLHYENLKSLSDKQLDVIRYLYMRLNIIDGKAGYLLRINALTASVISVLISFSAKAGGESIFTHINCLQAFLLVAALISIALAFFVTFAIGELEYDHITDPPGFFNQTEIGNLPRDYDSTVPAPTSRRFVGKYSRQDVQAILDVVNQGAGALRTLKDYEDEFFKITIARVRILRLARILVLLGVVFSMVFVVYFAISPPKDSATPIHSPPATASTPAPATPTAAPSPPASTPLPAPAAPPKSGP